MGSGTSNTPEPFNRRANDILLVSLAKCFEAARFYSVLDIIAVEIWRQCLNADLVASGGHGQALNNVTEFAYVARPRVAQHPVHHWPGEPARIAVSLVDLLETMVGERNDGFHPFAKWRDSDWHHV